MITTPSDSDKQAGPLKKQNRALILQSDNERRSLVLRTYFNDEDLPCTKAAKLVVSCRSNPSVAHFRRGDLNMDR